MAATHAPPKLIFGAAGVGDEFKDLAATKSLITALKEHGVKYIDTAALYPPTDMGASEKLLGESQAISQGFEVDTKVMLKNFSGDGSLTPEEITKSVNTSIERLQLKSGQKIRVLYIHAPDSTTPVRDQLVGFNEQYKKGHFEQFGVCNFSPELLKEFLEVSAKEGFIKPTIYQGRYNLIARELEGVFPLLREHGIHFIAHSPLATGFLSGSLTSGQIEGTRFVEGNMMGTAARQQYDKKEMHDAIVALDKALEPYGIKKPDAALRWLAFHSKLQPNDGILFGATKLNQITLNVESISKGPLPEDVVTKMDDLWNAISKQ